MRRALLVMMLAGGIAGGMLARAPVAWGCSCIASTPPADYANAELVFAGTATVVERSGAGGHVVATFALEEIFKGHLPRSVRVRTEAQGTACGVSFIAGTMYTVFAVPAEDGITTNICTGTTDDPSVRARMRDLAAVEGGAAGIQGAPVAAPPTALGESSARSGPIAAAGALLALASAGLLWRWRARLPQAEAR